MAFWSGRAGQGCGGYCGEQNSPNEENLCCFLPLSKIFLWLPIFQNTHLKYTLNNKRKALNVIYLPPSITTGNLPQASYSPDWAGNEVNWLKCNNSAWMTEILKVQPKFLPRGFCHPDTCMLMATVVGHLCICNHQVFLFVPIYLSVNRTAFQLLCAWNKFWICWNVVARDPPVKTRQRPSLKDLRCFQASHSILDIFDFQHLI